MNIKFKIINPVITCLRIAIILTLPLTSLAQENEEWQSLNTRVAQLERATETRSLVNLAGYATVEYTDIEDNSGNFNTVSYNPIFHYQFEDKILFEAELEMAIDEDGETEIALEYATIDWILNDHAVLVAGKFLSPLGFFRQNLHPSWINKLASAPVGFGHHGGAAPLADVGLQLRGGFSGRDTSRFNYAVYMGNGPELEAEGGEIHGVEAEGVLRDLDGKRVFGGRFGYLPKPGLELGVSLASGDTSIVEDDGMDISGDPARSYEVQGFDFAYQISSNFNLRMEWISQEVGDAAGSIVTEGGTWEAWYAQVTHVIPSSQWEISLRTGELTPPEADEKQEQHALSFNYLISSNAVLKLTFESNDAEAGQPADQNRSLFQFAYGF